MTVVKDIILIQVAVKNFNQKPNLFSRLGFLIYLL